MEHRGIASHQFALDASRSSGVAGSAAVYVWCIRSRRTCDSFISHMAKKKRDRIRVHKEARRLARRGLGMPPTERTIPDKRRKPVKHKKTITEIDAE